MIYTVTLNPALDYVVGVRQFVPGQTNRTQREAIVCGGKGINVSAMLANLGVKSRALGFAAGFTGEEIVRRVAAMGIEADFITLKEGFSRINVKLKSEQETEINGQGPEIAPKDIEELFGRLTGLREGDILVLSGSIPSSVKPDIYAGIMGQVSGRGVKCVVDAEKNLLLSTLKYHPFLIKPNRQELGAMFERELNTEEEIVACGRLLQEQGAENVLVSMAGNGSILIGGDGALYRQGVCRGRVINSVGAGDSMVAGFLAGFLEKKELSWALKLGTACGGATAFSEGIGTRENVEKLLLQL